jgi:uncharacterized membrane protein HdeD (DUF308 family)
MSKYKTVILVNGIVFIVLGLFMSVFGLAGVGAVGVVVGAFDLLIGLVLLAFESKKDAAQGMLLCGGILLLIGFSLCSAFPLNIH